MMMMMIFALENFEEINNFHETKKCFLNEKQSKWKPPAIQKKTY